MNSCQSIRDDLADCLSKTDCVLSGKTGQECLRDHMQELPTDCQAIYKSYVNCKRGLLDMRKRFRGNAPSTHRDNNAHGATTTIGSSASINEQSNRQRDPSIGLSPDRSDT